MKKTILKLAAVSIVLGRSLWADPLIISGQVRDETTRQPVEFGTVIISEIKFKARVQTDGSYAVAVPVPGEYTLQVSAPGLADSVKKISVAANTRFDFVLGLPLVKAQTIKLRADRDIQKVSRSTLTVEQLKQAPATFGDAINALATLPGVARSGGFFGPLIIRGVTDKANRYFIDDIPVPNPMHFGGLQSVISNDLIREVDLYSSAFPVSYGGALGAVIDIQTLDSFDKFGGIVDVSLISANFLLKSPWGKKTGGDVRMPTTIQAGSETTGYWISSGRIGYLTLLVPPIYEWITGKSIGRLPEYYDYQLKGKVFLDAAGRHALTGLVFGSYDRLRLARNLTPEESEAERSKGEDPLLANLNLGNDVSTHSQGIYYEYVASPKLKNRVTAFHSYTYSYFAFDLGINAPANSSNTSLKIYPDILGLKNKLSFAWSDFARINMAAEYNLFSFSASGQTQQLVSGLAENNIWDLANTSLFQTVPVNFSDRNQVISGSAENPFKFGRLTIIPGVRSDFLDRTRRATIDPRGLVSFEFPSETTLSVAGGQYQSFAQTNTFYFNQVFNYQPQVVVADYLEPERAIHRTFGIEQKTDAFVIKLEGFANDFDRLLEYAPASSGKLFTNAGGIRSRGVEFSVRKDSEGTANEFFGWLSYTYTRSERWRDGAWGNFEYEQPHSLKLVAGYRFGANTIGAQFQLYSGFPYTAIAGSTCSTGYDCSNTSTARYSPSYAANLYGSRYPFPHRLDIRFTRKVPYSWGYFSWYIEIINIYNYAAANEQKWSYNQPYSAQNPKLDVGDATLTLIPYFGLEWRF
ncbi:MAG: TonB-dependent receptor plug domain-containing protein [Spirochaetes bacterium]|nr:TonB-dependent receptor plug domain-containing protein [Spirochaetota bacterium]